MQGKPFLPSTERKTQHCLIYLLPGLGVNDTFFSSLRFPKGYLPILVPLKPARHKESIGSYSKRLSEHIRRDIPHILLGFSFGGLLAQEIATISKPAAVVLMASLTHSDQLPWYFRLASSWKIHKLISGRFIRLVLGYHRNFSSDTKKTVYSFDSLDASFLRWSIEKVLLWAPTPNDTPVFRIHGSDDKLFPCRHQDNLYIIERARHLLLPEKSAAVNEILREILKENVAGAHPV